MRSLMATIVPFTRMESDSLRMSFTRDLTAQRQRQCQQILQMKKYEKLGALWNNTQSDLQVQSTKCDWQ
jgi:hypothetical protein